MGSSRLPGKIAKDVGGRTVLDEVLRRCRAIKGVDVVVCATTTHPDDDNVVVAAERAGAIAVRGSVHDVLARYTLAATTVGADIVMRVTSDCPLIDPEVCGDVLTLLAEKRLDYACNNMPPCFPHGLDCEAFTFDALSRADREARDDYDREHVTPWLRRHPDLKRGAVEISDLQVKDHRWTLDFPEDFEFFKAVFEKLPAPPALPNWREVLRLLDLHPEITVLNAVRRVAR